MSGIHRRSVLKIGAMALATPWVSRAYAQQQSITLAAYTGIFEDNYRKAVLEPFMAANPGITVNYTGMPTSAQNLGQIRAQKSAPQIDVCILDVVVAKAGGDESLFKPVSATELPAIKQLMPNAIIPGTPGPAVMFDTLDLMYAPSKFPTAPTSWKALWDTKYQGRIAIDAPPNTIGVGLTLIAEKMAGGTNYNSNVEKGIKLLAELAPLVQTFEPKPDPYAMVVNGAADLSVGFNARAQTYSKANPDRMQPVIPDEGSVFQINTINLVNNSPRSEAALKFMEYALGPVAQKTFTETMFYAPSNLEAKISPEAAARTVSTPERMEHMLDVNWVEVAKIRDKITEQWRRNIINQ